MSRLSDKQVLGLVTGEDSTILDTAREITGIMRGAHVEAAIVGGVAVFLHGHRRATVDVDVFVADTADAHDALNRAGFTFDESAREFRRGAVPVHLVTAEQTGSTSINRIEIERIAVAALPDLIAMKLRSGLVKTTRAQDLADVVALIRVKNLTAAFASRLPRDLRSDFRGLVRAVERDA